MVGQNAVEDAKRLIEQGAHVEALELLNLWLQANPDDASAWETVATAHVATGNWEAAEQATREAVRLLPDSARAWCNMGMVLRKLGRVGDAAAAQRRALARDRGYSRANVEMEKLRALRHTGSESGSPPDATGSGEDMHAPQSEPLPDNDPIASAVASYAGPAARTASVAESDWPGEAYRAARGLTIFSYVWLVLCALGGGLGMVLSFGSESGGVSFALGAAVVLTGIVGSELLRGLASLLGCVADIANSQR